MSPNSLVCTLCALLKRGFIESTANRLLRAAHSQLFNCVFSSPAACAESRSMHATVVQTLQGTVWVS